MNLIFAPAALFDSPQHLRLAAENGSELPVIEDRSGFWRDACTIHGAITPHVMPLVFVVGSIAAAVCISAGPIERLWGIQMELPVGPYEIAGAVLGLLLVLRTNAGYDRWWEARKPWGGIVK